MTRLTVGFSQATGSGLESLRRESSQVLLVTGQVQAGYSVDVSVAVTGGAASPADYTNTATVTIGGGVYDGTNSTAVATNLAITDDRVVEPDETIELTLSTASPQVTLGTQTTTEYTILDDDTLTVEFDTASSSDDEAAAGTWPVLLVTGEVQTGYSVDVSVAVTGGTAGAADYTNTATVTIGAGVYDGTLATAVATNLTITDDSVVEPDETIELTLSTASPQVTLGSLTRTEYTILDDDTLTVEFETAEFQRSRGRRREPGGAVGDRRSAGGLQRGCVGHGHRAARPALPTTRTRPR